jgi:uncharacterized membrane protein
MEGARNRRRCPHVVDKMVARLLQPLFYLAYPLIVYFGYTRLPARQLGLLLLCLYAASFAVGGRGVVHELRSIVRQHLPLVALIAIATLADNAKLLLLVPMIVSGYLLVSFSMTLRHGPPMIERFARAIEGDLPPFTHAYCRQVTIIWSGFLACNTIAIGLLTAFAPLEIWALYTGGIFYVLLALLIVGEICYRKWLFRFYGDGPIDRVFARIFPAENTERGRRSVAYDQARRSKAG